MKKLIRVLFITILCLTAFKAVKAEDDHIIFDDYASYFSASALSELNSDMAQIEKNYDIGVYVVIDKNVEDAKGFADSYLSVISNAKNVVVLVDGKSAHSIVSKGSDTNKIQSSSNDLWKAYNNASTKYDGIKSFYQSVVKIINGDSGAVDIPKVDNRVKLHDSASLFTSDEVNKLSNKLNNLCDQYGVDIVVHTANNLGGKTTQQYADDFYDYNNYNNDGVLLLIDMENRIAYISTKGRCITYLTDYGVDHILNNMESYLSKAQYYKAVDAFADTSASLINEGMNGNIIDNNNKPKKFTLKNLGISGFAAGLSTLITSIFLKGQMKTMKKQRYARNYVVEDSFVLNGMSDMLIDRKVTRTPRTSRTSRSGPTGGGGSSTHTSSSGSSHGGHGRSF